MKPSFLRVSLLGSGFLGGVLASAFKPFFECVSVSTRSLEKCTLLNKLGLSSFLVSFSESSPSLFTGDQSFFDTDILVVSLPFSRAFLNPFLYYEQCLTLSKLILNSPVSCVVFTSSTSYYPNTSGLICTEETPCDVSSERAMVLHQVEQLFLNLPGIQSYVFRLGGIYSKERLLSRKGLRDNAYMNVISCEDAASFILDCVLSRPSFSVFNCVESEHPSRLEFYRSFFAKEGLLFDPPTFTQEPFGKIVSNDLLRATFRIPFKHSLLDLI